SEGMVSMSLESPPELTITAWDKDYTRRGPVVGFNSASVTFVDNGPGEAVFEVDADHLRVPDLTAPGARVVVHYAPADAWLSGTVEEVTGEGLGDVAVRTFRVRDDWAEIFQSVTGWIIPGNGIRNQGDDETAYYRLSGPAETVVETAGSANAGRVGVELRVRAAGGWRGRGDRARVGWELPAPRTHGRGSNIEVSLRMHPLADRLYPAVDQAGIGVRVVQKNTPTRTLEVYEPVTRGTVLTEASEVVVQGSYQIQPPTVTRVVVGCGGEAAARDFFLFVDSAAEAQWGVVRESFVDARDLGRDEYPSDAELEAAAQPRAEEALLEGAAKTGLSVELAETEYFRFGSAFDVGDRISVQLNGAPVLTDRVREVTVSWTPDEGLLVVPIIGDWQDSTDDQVYKIVSAAARGVRNLRSAY